MTRSGTSPEPMGIDLSQRGAVASGAEIANIIVTLRSCSRWAIEPHLPQSKDKIRPATAIGELSPTTTL